MKTRTPSDGINQLYILAQYMKRLGLTIPIIQYEKYDYEYNGQRYNMIVIYSQLKIYK